MLKLFITALQKSSNGSPYTPQINASPVSAMSSIQSGESQKNSTSETALFPQTTITQSNIPPTPLSQVQTTTVLKIPQASSTGSSLTMPPPPNPPLPCRFQPEQVGPTLNRSVAGNQTQQQRATPETTYRDNEVNGPMYTGNAHTFLAPHSQPQFSGTSTNAVIIGKQIQLNSSEMNDYSLQSVLLQHGEDHPPTTILLADIQLKRLKFCVWYYETAINKNSAGAFVLRTCGV